eukprot:TRINITY_DN4790_c0_g3_i2.p1 TRINITY_DN4790_c0_g3~~TRINITY_DN4790_c0_g3_i2.p1  ORF type:complete len:789 (+),score=169.42 TRINITY_DN4790_c0_g3_i2:93-2459(+)
MISLLARSRQARFTLVAAFFIRALPLLAESDHQASVEEGGEAVVHTAAGHEASGQEVVDHTGHEAAGSSTAGHGTSGSEVEHEAGGNVAAGHQDGGANEFGHEPAGHEVGSEAVGDGGGHGESGHGNETGGHVAVADETGGHEAGGHEAGGHEAGGHEAGGHEASGHNAVGGAETGLKNYGYTYIGDGEVKHMSHDEIHAIGEEGHTGAEGHGAEGHEAGAASGEHGGHGGGHEGGHEGGGHEGGHEEGHEEGGHEERIAKDLICVVVFWFLIWFSGRLAGWTRLSPLLYYLIFGCILGNLGFGFLELHESHFMKTFSVLAISIVFFALGLEENVKHFLEGIKMAYGIAIIGAAVPFAIGFGCTSLFWPDAPKEVALMGGLAVTATAVSLTMIALKAEGLATSKPAIGIMTSAVLDDIASLALVAICVPIATGEAAPSVLGIVLVMAKAGGFFVVVIFGHILIFPNDITEGIFANIPGLRSFGVQNFLRWRSGEQATLISLIVGLLWGMIAILFGFHPAIGAYMGGLIMEHKYFDIPEENAQGHANTFDEVLHHVETVAYGWLGPFFFMELGSAILVDLDVLSRVIWFTLLFYVLLFIGQFVSAAGAARFVPGGFDIYESALIGFGMMGRAELFFVVLELCYVEHHIMTRDMVCTFAFVAMLMNVSVPVCITLFKPVYIRAHPEALEDGEEDDQEPLEDYDANIPSAEKHGKPVDLDMIEIKGVRSDDYEEDSDSNEVDDTESTSTGGQEVAGRPAAQKSKRSPNRGRVFGQVCGCLGQGADVGSRIV